MRQIILASQSPRRQALLSKMGLHFQAVPSNYDEQLDDSRSPEEVAIELALGKARQVASQYPEAFVIGSDCIVSLGGRQLGKVSSEAEALELFKLYAQTPVKVVTSVVVVCQSTASEASGCEIGWLHFKPYDESAVKAYLAGGDYKDKAGAIAVQAGTGPLIERLEGNFDAIVGLPTATLAKLLDQVGFSLPVARTGRDR